MSDPHQRSELGLERRVQTGNAFDVGNIKRDLENGHLSFEIIGDPETGQIVRTLIFTGYTISGRSGSRSVASTCWSRSSVCISTRRSKATAT